nr:zinc finger, CCHC-type [Tanacetum cinerariifolium]
MAGNTVKDMTTNFEKLDKFVGHDFRRWQKKMHFFLTTLNVVYVLTTPMPELLEDATTSHFKRYYRSGKKNNANAGGSGKGSKDPSQDQGHVHYKRMLEMSKDELIPAIYENSDKCTTYDLSFVQLGSHLRIEESLRAQDSDKGKGKEVGGPSVNMTEDGVVKRTTQMLMVREKGLRTHPKTKVDAIAWWIDSGATTLVCKDRCWFKTFEPAEDESVLYMGDEHFAHVHGKGSVAIEFNSGKTVTLFNVLYVPKLRKNLVSGRVLNKCGYKQVYESDKYIL